MAHLMLLLADGLSDEERHRALETAPDYAETVPGYDELLSEAGFEEAELIDITPAYLDTLVAWFEAWEGEARDLEALLGAEEFAERMTNRRRSIENIRDGLVERLLVTAKKRRGI